MAIWRSPELEAIFGGPLDSTTLTETALNQLIADQIRENEQFDVKSTFSMGSNKDWTVDQEFAKDIAAFANHRGGMLIVGVNETNEVVSGLNPITQTTAKAEIPRLQQALVNYLAPHTQTEFIEIGAATPPGWYLAVIVPPSRRAPHAVLNAKGDARTALRYPVRSGAHSRWMDEHEVADRYRRRFSAAEDEQSRIERVVEQGKSELRRTDHLWLYAAVIPENPSPGRLTKDAFTRIEDWESSNRIQSPFGAVLPGGNGIAAPKRVTFTRGRTTDQEDETTPRDGYVELHIDGSAFAALKLGDDRKTATQITMVDGCVTLVDLATQWCAEQVGAWGTATLVAGIEDSGSPKESPPEHLQLVTNESGVQKPVHRSRIALESPVTEVIVDLSQVDSVQRRLAVTHAALCGILQHFGLVQPSQLKSDGTIAVPRWGTSAYDRVKRWCEGYDVNTDLVGLD